MKELEVKEQFVELRAKGMSYNKIAKQLHVSKTTLFKWASDLSLEIVNRKREEIKAVRDEFGLHKLARAKSLALLVQKIEKELQKRSFRNVKTEKLFELTRRLKSDFMEETKCVGSEMDWFDSKSQ